MVIQGDSGSRPRLPPSPDIWTLPEIETVEIARVRYVPPRPQAMKGKLLEIGEGVEIVVRTSGPIPLRALAPALHVGAAEVAESEQLGPTAYRFFVLDDAALVPGTPIRLGWVGMPSREEPTRCLYRAPDGAPITRHWRDRPRPQKSGLWRLLVWLVWRLLRRLSGSPVPH